MIIAYPQGAWDWFKIHHEKLKYPSRLPAHDYRYWIKQFQKEVLNRTLTFLFVEVRAEESKHQAQMIFSAHGNPKYFDMVELMVLSAPVIDGWNYTAFYPPVSPQDCLHHNYPTIVATLNDLYFSPLELVQESGRYNLQLYTSENIVNETEWNGAASQMMFNLLGEKIGGLYIRRVRVTSLLQVPIEFKNDLVPFSKLPSYIQLDSRSGLSINGMGLLK